MKKILIFGGTNFIGRNLVELLQQDENNDLTLFNRGITNPNVFDSIKIIKGDRYSEADISKLGLDWDYIIDISCYFPKSIDLLAKLKYKNLKKYIFILTLKLVLL